MIFSRREWEREIELGFVFNFCFVFFSFFCRSIMAEFTKKSAREIMEVDKDGAAAANKRRCHTNVL